MYWQYRHGKIWAVQLKVHIFSQQQLCTLPSKQVKQYANSVDTVRSTQSHHSSTNSTDTVKSFQSYHYSHPNSTDIVLFSIRPLLMPHTPSRWCDPNMGIWLISCDKELGDIVYSACPQRNLPHPHRTKGTSGDLGEKKKKQKLTGPGRQKLEREKFLEVHKCAGIYYDELLALRKERLIPLGSQQRGPEPLHLQLHTAGLS